MSLRVFVHGGADRIGASCIEIASAATRLIFDCGWPLEREGSLQPPAVPGLFVEGAPPHALLLTHAHGDHVGFIEEMKAAVPIYATIATSKIMKVGSIYAGGVTLPRRQFCGAPVPRSASEEVRTIPVGDIRVTAYPVDHSTPGAVGYLVEHAGERIFYTGDLRFHGWKPGMHRRILRDLRGRLDLLITEGTNVGRVSSGLRSEQAVVDRAVALLADHSSLALAAYSPQNIDRFVSYFQAALRTGRTFVCDHYQAAVLHQLNLASLPRPSRGGLRIYHPTRRVKVARYERHYPEATIEWAEIASAPQHFLMLTRPAMLREIGASLPRGSRLFYGLWSGYLKSREWQEAQTLLAESGSDLLECHCSGHAFEDELFRFIAELAPKRIQPVHTEAAKLFKLRFGERVVQSTE